MGEKVFDLFYEKLVGNISKSEFDERYKLLIFEDVKDINGEVLYGGL